MPDASKKQKWVFLGGRYHPEYQIIPRLLKAWHWASNETQPGIWKRHFQITDNWEGSNHQQETPGDAGITSTYADLTITVVMECQRVEGKMGNLSSNTIFKKNQVEILDLKQNNQTKKNWLKKLQKII